MKHVVFRKISRITMETIKSCCMIGCINVSSSDGKCLFGFPTDFNLCMLWVQNSGKPEHFEDFAFGGAQPFLNRHICSDHFLEKDFIDVQNKNLGLFPGSIPNLNLAINQVDIKEECVDQEYATVLNVMPVLSQIKLEKSENDTCEDDVNANVSFSSNDDSGNDLYTSRDPLSENDAEEIKLSNDFFRDYNNAMKINIRRSNESEKARLLRLKKEAIRAKQRRSKETEEQTKIRRMKNALRAAFRRKNETPEQRETRRIKDMLRAQMKRKAETETQARIRKYNDAVRAAYRRKNETEEERKERRMKDTMRAAKRRSMETPEQRQLRLSKDRERASKKRMLKKIFEQMGRLNETNDVLPALPVPVGVKKETSESDTDSSPLPDSSDSTPLTMSSLGSVVGHCSESSNMERLQEVLRFIRKKVRAQPKSKRLTDSSDDSRSFMTADDDDTTNEGDGMYPADNTRYQQNILNFLSWNRLHPQPAVAEIIPYESLGRVSYVGNVQEGYSTDKSLLGDSFGCNEGLR